MAALIVTTGTASGDLKREIPLQNVQSVVSQSADGNGNVTVLYTTGFGTVVCKETAAAINTTLAMINKTVG